MFLECFIAVYAGWSAQTWLVGIASSALIPAFVSTPFWIHRDRGFGIAAVLTFAAFISIHGAVQCVPEVPDGVMLAVALACLGVVVSCYVVIFMKRAPPQDQQV